MTPTVPNLLHSSALSVSRSALCDAKPKEKPREGTGLSGPHRVNDFGNYAYARITTRCVDKGDNSRILARCDIGATPESIGMSVVRERATP